MADIFDVIADGTRRDILGLLRERDAPDAGGMSVSEIVAQIGVSQPTVSKHLRVLRGAHLVMVREQGQRRFYSIQAGPLDEVRTWMALFAPAGEPVHAGDDTAQPERARCTPDPAGGPDRSHGSVVLPQPAVRVADAVGHAAASARRAWEGILQKLPGR